MKHKIFAAFFMALLLAIGGCSKSDKDDDTPDWASAWQGTYTGTAGGSVNRVIATKITNKTVRMDLQALVSGSYYTFATIDAAVLATATSAAVDEDGTILTEPGQNYRFTGSATLSGNQLTIIGQAVNKQNASDIKYYPFDGTK